MVINGTVSENAVVRITFVFRPEVGDLRGDNTKTATIIEN